MVPWTNFHDNRTQYREINSNLQIYINITGVPKLLEGSVYIMHPVSTEVSHNRKSSQKKKKKKKKGGGEEGGGGE